MARAGEVSRRWQEVIPSLTARSKDGKGWECPLCGHGKGGDGLKANPKGKPGSLKCFGCGFSGDIVDLYGRMSGQGFREVVDELGARLGIQPGSVEPIKRELPSLPAKTEPPPALDFTAYFAECRARLADPRAVAYLQGRGISLPTAERYGLGFDPAADVAGKGYPCPRLILPTCKGHYVGRRVDGVKDFAKMNPKGSTPGIFNVGALQGEGVAFIVEGIMDALSIAEAGAEAVALSSTANAARFVKHCREHRPKVFLLLALDNDKAGKGAAETLRAGLEAEKIPFRVVTLCGEGKDPNDELTANRAEFVRRVQEAMNPRGFDPWAGGVASLVEAVEGGIYDPFPIGIKPLDDILGGGLMRQQLAVIGAPPAGGKTALCQQIAETMAIGREDFSCLYFCFEMSRNQLQARGAARLYHVERGGNLSQLDIMRGGLGWREAVDLYREKVAGKVAYMCPGAGVDGAELASVKAAIQEGAAYCRRLGRPAPFVVIDYLQLLRDGDKDEQEAIKAAMDYLKGYAVENDSIVIGVVANNRESNKNGGTVSMFSGRGSSSIEYGADIVLGLAYSDELDKAETVDKSRRSVVLTKGRFTAGDGRADFSFNGRYSLFLPSGDFGRAVSAKENRDINSLLGYEVR